MKQFWQVYVSEVITIVAAAVVLGILFNAVHVNGIPLIAQERIIRHEADFTQMAEIPLDEEPGEPLIISLEQASTYFETGEALFIDARKSILFELGHIPKARLMPWSVEIPPKIPPDLPREKLLIIYCSDIGCEMSAELAFYLYDAGFGHTRIFEDGWDAWENAGLLIETGETNEKVD
ncbi:rhodanese-like domain-containing protein [bacterium]|nr:rhodanese-like domain-containing protein [bacterium]